MAKKSPTRAQLEVGASGIAYRARQLAGVAAITLAGGADAVAVPEAGGTVSNALIESGLVNARALAWFFAGHKNDINFAMFDPAWSDRVLQIADKIVEPISRHLSHATTGASDGEKHPGEWPLVELSLVLVGALARFVEAMPSTPDVDARCFKPSPIVTHNELQSLNPPIDATPISKNESVAKLTQRLQKYLAP